MQSLLNLNPFGDERMKELHLLGISILGRTYPYELNKKEIDPMESLHIVKEFYQEITSLQRKRKKIHSD